MQQFLIFCDPWMGSRSPDIGTADFRISGHVLICVICALFCANQRETERSGNLQ